MSPGRNGDVRSWRDFADLAAFVGVFSVVVYAGGFAYVRAYYAAFNWNENFEWGLSYVASSFFNQVMLAPVAPLVWSLVSLALIAGAFFLAGVVPRRGAGYTILCGIFTLALLLSVHFGELKGSHDARRDWLTGESRLPVVAVTLAASSSIGREARERIRRPDCRMLLEDDDGVYMFAPLQSADDQSCRIVDYVARGEIAHMAVSRSAE